MDFICNNEAIRDLNIIVSEVLSLFTTCTYYTLMDFHGNCLHNQSLNLCSYSIDHDFEKKNSDVVTLHKLVNNKQFIIINNSNDKDRMHTPILALGFSLNVWDAN